MKRLLANSSFVVALSATMLAPSWAGILDDDEARKAILELRTEVRKRDAEQTQTLKQNVNLISQDISTVNANALSLNTALQTTNTGLQSTNQDLGVVKQSQAALTEQLIRLADQLDKLGAASSDNQARLRAEFKSELTEQNKQIDTLRRGNLELNNQLTQSREDNARLRGQLEVIVNSQQTTSSASLNELQTLRRKLTDSEAANLNELQTLRRKLSESEAASDARLKKLEPRTVAVDGKEAVVDRAEESSFNAALSQFKAADYKAASRGFETFVAQYPQSGLLGTALFWQGNSQYANRDPRAAIASLQTMLQKFPQHVRSADANLTIAHCHNELGDKRRSTEMYQLVMDNYPGTLAAQAALESMPKAAPPAPTLVPTTPSPVKKKA
jgi:tol-pal system protein YbgF